MVQSYVDISGTPRGTDMCCSGAWKTASFKKYNFDAEGAPQHSGALHPLMKVREEFRNIFFEMGSVLPPRFGCRKVTPRRFTEMPTNKFVESSFWNFDVLFVPQQHPARELQDTFYIKGTPAVMPPLQLSTRPDPPSSDSFPKEYMEKVRAVHENGGETSSLGYRYKWKQSEAEKLVLRTHTTSVSGAMLHKLANLPGGFKPAKLFSIDRVFRNEAVDATHLAEFHQIEGVVADYHISLGDLIGFMEIFFNKMGITQLRFKPAYNPYTEPSLEIFSYHAGLGKWVEIGNSGIFRPGAFHPACLLLLKSVLEMLEPMGLPKDVRVLGWGLSLERPTMIRYGIKNIRDLVGHKVPLEMVEKAAACVPLCRLRSPANSKAASDSSITLATSPNLPWRCPSRAPRAVSTRPPSRTAGTSSSPPDPPSPPPKRTAPT
jgi:phenylalanyl-tRNA synthetase alpha chain